MGKLHDRLDAIKVHVAVVIMFLSVLGVCAGVGIWVATNTQFLTIPTEGDVVTMGNLTSNPSSLQWGTVTFGVPQYRTVDLSNIGNATITNLNLTYSEATLTSILTNYTVTWNLEGQSISPAETKVATFTLTVYDADEGNFQLMFYINGE